MPTFHLSLLTTSCAPLTLSVVSAMNHAIILPRKLSCSGQNWGVAGDIGETLVLSIIEGTRPDRWMCTVDDHVKFPRMYTAIYSTALQHVSTGVCEFKKRQCLHRFWRVCYDNNMWAPNDWAFTLINSELLITPKPARSAQCSLRWHLEAEPAFLPTYESKTLLLYFPFTLQSRL